MDISRPELAAKRKRRRNVTIVVVLLCITAAAIMVHRLEPAVPTVERSAIWLDIVKKGEMRREVRGNGTLIPDKILVVPTEVGGRVTKIEVLPGTTVEADTVILELSNPPLKQQAFDLEHQLKGAQAKFNQLQAQLEEARNAVESKVAELESQVNLARLEAEADQKLAQDGLVADLTMKQSRGKADDLARQLVVEKSRINTAKDSAKAQIAVSQSDIDKLEAAFKQKQREVESLTVRAGIAGVVQQIGPIEDKLIEVGGYVASGNIVVKIVQPDKLMARIKIAETQAKDVAIGLPAVIDTRSGTVDGKVARIDPSVVAGTVTVDVHFTGALPKGARPDLSVDGVIELERIPDIKYVGRPVNAQEDTTISLFKIVEGGYALRVPVSFGRVSVTSIEVLEGLEPGDEVIMSDMTAHEDHPKLKITE